MQISKLKCSKCRCEFIPILKPSGLPYKTCGKCREYNKQNNKEYYQENKDKLKEYNKKYRQINQDKLNKQKQNYYENNKDRAKEYNEKNKDKIKERNKQYKIENVDKIKKYYQENKDKIKEYKEENAEKLKEYQQKYRKENAEKLKKYFQELNQTNKRKEYEKQRNKKLKNNLQRYLVHSQRTKIIRCFKNSSLNKSKHSIEYLGCDIEIFINHIKKKIDLFNEKNEIKMTFDNIHLDHIKPISRFNLDDEEEFLSCCHYTNLQPLLIKDNLEKGNKWNDENNKFWIENIKDKEYYEIYI